MLFYNVLNFSKLAMVKLKSNSTGKSKGRTTVQHRCTGFEYYVSSSIDYKRMAYDQLSLTIYFISRLLKPGLFVLLYEYGFIGLILAPENLHLNNFIISSLDPLPCKPGNAMPIRHMPVGSKIHNIGYAARSSGVFAQILRHKKQKSMCRLPSGKTAWFSSYVVASCGVLLNAKRSLFKMSKAGYAFLKGKRPTVRGTAMNPIDHPHGGGQGKTSGGRPSVTPYGRGTKGYKTRRNAK